MSLPTAGFLIAIKDGEEEEGRAWMEKPARMNTVMQSIVIENTLDGLLNTNPVPPPPLGSEVSRSEAWCENLHFFFYLFFFIFYFF